MLLRYNGNNLHDGLDIISLGLFAIILSPWITRIVGSLKVGGVELNFVKHRIDEQQTEIDAIKFLFAHFLSHWELHHLRALVNGDEFIVDVGHFPDDLKRELRRLRELGLIEGNGPVGLADMFNDPRKTKSLHEYFRATPRGKKYVDMQKKMGNIFSVDQDFN